MQLGQENDMCHRLTYLYQLTQLRSWRPRQRSSLENGTVGTNDASQETSTVVLVARPARKIGTVGTNGVSHATGTVGLFYPWMRAADCFFKPEMLAQIVEKSVSDD